MQTCLEGARPRLLTEARLFLPCTPACLILSLFSGSSLSVLWFLFSFFRSCELEEDRSRRPAQTQHKPALLPSPALGPTTPNPAQTRSSLCPLSSVTCGLWSRAVSISEHSLSRCNISLFVRYSLSLFPLIFFKSSSFVCGHG